LHLGGRLRRRHEAARRGRWVPRRTAIHHHGAEHAAAGAAVKAAVVADGAGRGERVTEGPRRSAAAVEAVVVGSHVVKVAASVGPAHRIAHLDVHRLGREAEADDRHVDGGGAGKASDGEHRESESGGSGVTHGDSSRWSESVSGRRGGKWFNTLAAERIYAALLCFAGC